MWTRTIQGKTLTFHLAGIHNQNFLMRDEETGSFWQQVTGECVAGPMRGAQLERVHNDELTIARFRAESLTGQVLLGEPGHSDSYERDWELGIDELPTVVDTSDSPLPPRALVAGVAVGGKARAYEASRLAAEPVILDEIGEVPVVLWSGGGRMLRAFERRVDGKALLLAPADGEHLRDAETGSLWDFRGCAVEGPQAEAKVCMTSVPVLWDYWFDWRAYNPETDIYGR
ncbi:DUF3179 domain-containing (seleno)protein [Nannocystis sp. ILAH1]|uniref:DUF3179 domain-containing (seleno)protein n=1 Tax=Nannocystis sp. ILAH1 TaxID=2996789 RepID=UPI002271BC4C|nr:DUF3179 domain-containing (seleno)protein [Nannocystis sp. ILAH1]